MAKEDEESTPFQSVNGPEPNKEKKTSTTNLRVENLQAPDGGWGWMVVLGVCICHLILGLIIKAFGVTYLILIDKFHSSATATIWIGAITVTCLLTTGPLTSALCRRFGCRRVAIVGAALVVTGLIATGQAPNIYVIYVTFGLITGVGLGFNYTSGFFIIAQYFDKRKALALSLTSVANGASDLIFPPLLVFLSKEFGFSGMFLIMGGICLHLFVGAFLYRPLNLRAKSSKMPSTLGKPTTAKSIICCISSKKLSVKEEDHDIKDECLKTHTEDNKQDDIKQKSTKERYSALFKNCAFIAFAIISMCIISAVSMISTLLPAIAVDNGVDKTRAAFLLATCGISRVIGSLALGHLFDLEAIRRSREHIYAGWCVVLGVMVLLMGVVSTYPAYITLCVLTGIATGVLMPQRITIIGDIVGKTSDMEGFGVVTFMNTFGGLFSRGIAGPIKDFTGRYNMAFLLSGSFTLIAALVFEAAIIRHKRAQRKLQQTQTKIEVVADT